MNTQHFEQLLSSFLDDRLTDADLNELAKLLAENNVFRERFQQETEMAEALAVIENEERASEPFSQLLQLRLEAELQKFDFLNSLLDRSDLQGSRGTMLRRISFAFVALSVCVSISFWTGSWIATQTNPDRNEIAIGNDHERPEVDELVDDSVAILRHAVDTVWHGDTYLLPGDTVSSGETIQLVSGLVQLQFLRGATVTLQGPARLEIRDLDVVLLHEGEVWAHVPEPARGFTVLTPETEVVDLGTEFAVSVVPGKPTEVQVFDGLVELYEPGTNRSHKSRRELLAGEGVAVDMDGHSAPLPDRVSKMPTTAMLLERQREQRRRGFERWLAWSKQAKQDPRVLLYYDFHRQEESDATLYNQCDMNQHSDGAIVGCSWTKGRWTDKAALEFKRPSDRVRFQLPGDFEEITLAAWVRVDGLDRPFNSLLLTDEWDEGEVHWQFDRDGQLGFSINGARGTPWRYTDPLVDLRQLGRWIHVATVFDRRQKNVRHYFNGQLVSQDDSLDYSGLIRIGAAELGNWGRPLRQSGHPIRNFNGRMDEFILYSAALEDSEILQMFEAGNPYE